MNSPFRAVLLTNILYMAVLPFVIYHFASPYMSVVVALLLSALPPALRTVSGLLKRGRLNLIGVLALLTVAVKLITGLVFQDPRLILISDSMVTGVHGVLLLGSLLIGMPLLQVLARNMLATMPTEQSEQLLKRWQEPRFHAFFMWLTALVGVGLLLELVVRLWLVLTLPIDQFMVVSPIVHYGLYGCALLAVILFVRLNRRSRKQRQLVGEVAQQEEELV